MARPKSAVPAYRLHKRTGQAVVYIDRREVYLGAHGSPESRRKYAEIVSRRTGGDETIARSPTDNPAPPKSVAALCLRFIAEKLPSYADAEQHCQRGAIKVLAGLFGDTPAADFGPIRLRTVRNAMVAGDPHATGADGTPKPRSRGRDRSSTIR